MFEYSKVLIQGHARFIYPLYNGDRGQKQIPAIRLNWQKEDILSLTFGDIVGIEAGAQFMYLREALSLRISKKAFGDWIARGLEPRDEPLMVFKVPCVMNQTEANPEGEAYVSKLFVHSPPLCKCINFKAVLEFKRPKGLKGDGDVVYERNLYFSVGALEKMLADLA